LRRPDYILTPPQDTFHAADDYYGGPWYDALMAKHKVQRHGGERRQPHEHSYRDRKERAAGLDDGEALDVAGIYGDMGARHMTIKRQSYGLYQ